MLEAIRRAGARLLGVREVSLSVPVFDGAYAPNNILEEASVFFEQAGLEDIAISHDGSLYAACGQEVLRLDRGGQATIAARFDAPLHALALRPDGGFAVAADGKVHFHGGAEHGRQLADVEGHPLHGVNALHTAPDGALLISEGSMRRPYAEWSRDLLEHGQTGRVLQYDPSQRSTKVIASGLAYCFGVCTRGGAVLAAESWAHRIVEVKNNRVASALDALPGYPARLQPAADGGYWLSLFAGRTQLLEFILRERDFREEMMRTVPPQYWFAPSLLSGLDFLEPQQTAGVMQMGIKKPWAPPRSYGLAVRLGADLQPLYSLHSRVGGRNHGVVSALEYGDDLFILSKGAGRILRLSLSRLTNDLGQRNQVQ